MRRLVRSIVTLAALGGAVIVLWRRNRRVGTGLMNERVNPYLLRRGVSGSARGQIATLEHVGRRSGIRRLTLVHPERTDDGFRVLVPLADRSEWARNVLAVGHCRMSLEGTVYELDEPALVGSRQIPGLPAVRRTLERLLGFKYLQLRRFAEHPGTLEPVAALQEPAAALEPAASAPASEETQESASPEVTPEGATAPEEAEPLGVG